MTKPGYTKHKNPVRHTIDILLHSAEFIQALQSPVVNVTPFNLTGHPALSLNVGKVKPDDVSISSQSNWTDWFVWVTWPIVIRECL